MELFAASVHVRLAEQHVTLLGWGMAALLFCFLGPPVSARRARGLTPPTCSGGRMRFGNVRSAEHLVGAMKNHETDRVAAAAVKASAQVITTSNLKDFGELATDHYSLISASTSWVNKVSDSCHPR